MSIIKSASRTLCAAAGMTFALLAGCGANGAPTASPATPAAAQESALAGYTRWDSMVAYQWITDGSTGCGRHVGFCRPIQVLATRRCPNGVYIEMDMLDEFGATMGHAADLTKGLLPGQVVKVGVGRSTESLPNHATDARLTRLDCR